MSAAPGSGNARQRRRQRRLMERLVSVGASVAFIGRAGTIGGPLMLLEGRVLGHSPWSEVRLDVTVRHAGYGHRVQTVPLHQLRVLRSQLGAVARL